MVLKVVANWFNWRSIIYVTIKVNVHNGIDLKFHLTTYQIASTYCPDDDNFRDVCCILFVHRNIYVYNWTIIMLILDYMESKISMSSLFVKIK